MKGLGAISIENKPQREGGLTKVGSTSLPVEEALILCGECGVGNPPDVSVGLRPFIFNGGGVLNGGESLWLMNNVSTVRIGKRCFCA